MLSDVLADDDDYRRRFEREARVAARLQHSGLVAVYDVGTESGRPYLVMELVPGDTLAERIAAGTAGDLDLVTLARSFSMRSRTSTARASCTATSSRATS